MTTDTNTNTNVLYVPYNQTEASEKGKKKRKDHHRDGDGPHNHLNCHVLHKVPGIRTVSPAACITSTSRPPVRASQPPHGHRSWR